MTATARHNRDQKRALIRGTVPSWMLGVLTVYDFSSIIPTPVPPPSLLRRRRIHRHLDHGRPDLSPFPLVEQQRDPGDAAAYRVINPHGVEAIVPSVVREADLRNDRRSTSLPRELDEC